MEIKLPKLSFTLFHLALLFSFSSAIPSYDHQTSICNKTPFPSFCKSLLQPQPSAISIQDYTRHCMSESLAKANEFQSLVNKHLKSSQSNSYALQNCQFLVDLNVDLLSKTSNTIKSTNTLGRNDADQVQTMLSAIITNLYTCSDELQTFEPSSSLARDFKPHFTNGSMLYSVSLALFSHGWDLIRENNSLFFNNGNVNPNGLPWDLGKLFRGAGYGKKWKTVFYELGICGIKVNKMVIVNPDGSGDFTTITDAVTSAPSNTEANSGYFGIYVVAGVYEEYVNIPKSKTYLFMVGDGINQTVITGKRRVGSGWTTFNSASFVVTATGFVAVDITFQNTAGAIMNQAVAVRNGADLSAFYRCSFEGYQDTLYTHSMRQFYKQCDIYGTVDFIFGNAAAVFQDCNIYPRQPLKGQFNAITAQGREDRNQNTGYSIHHCTIRPTSDLASSSFSVQTYLGRPWKEYSRTVYMQSYMDSFINYAGWHELSGSFALDTLYYVEFNNVGPGSSTSNRVTWPGYLVIDAVNASDFTVSNFIMSDFWLPFTGVPYNGGFYLM